MNKATPNPRKPLPPIVPACSFNGNRPPLPPELISGILRCGHKMLVSGPSKAGKSFLLMQLALAIVRGGSWLGFSCRKGKVLYLNFEIDSASCVDRFYQISRSIFRDENLPDGLDIWNLRGQSLQLDQFLEFLIPAMQEKHYDALIIDPIYKVITGDENNATEMARFCSNFDTICQETGSAVIYCHHHSKGQQGQKQAMDRASGSGVFARDPDALLDIIELEMTEEALNCRPGPYSTAWKMESSLREFHNIRPVYFWYDYPVHVKDDETLSKLYVKGTKKANLSKSSRKNTDWKKKREDFDKAFSVLNMDKNGTVSRQQIAKYLGVDDRTVIRYIERFSDGYEKIQGGYVKKRPQETKKAS